MEKLAGRNLSYSEMKLNKNTYQLYVSREPFVQEITHIVCTDDTELNIKVFTSYNKPEVFRRVKDFEFVLDKKGNLQLKK